jgi:hypothetical protein
MKKISKLILAGFIVLNITILAHPVIAQQNGQTSGIFSGISCISDTESTSAGDCSTEDMIAVAINITNLLLGTIGSVALLFFIIAGIQMIYSQGSQEKISKAKSMMLNSVIGITIALCSFLIVSFVRKEILGMPNGKVIDTIQRDSYKP